MEFMGGGTLTDILEMFPTIQMTENEVAYIMLEVQFNLIHLPISEVTQGIGIHTQNASNP